DLYHRDLRCRWGLYRPGTVLDRSGCSAWTRWKVREGRWPQGAHLGSRPRHVVAPETSTWWTPGVLPGVGVRAEAEQLPDPGVGGDRPEPPVDPGEVAGVRSVGPDHRQVQGSPLGTLGTFDTETIPPIRRGVT